MSATDDRSESVYMAKLAEQVSLLVPWSEPRAGRACADEHPTSAGPLSDPRAGRPFVRPYARTHADRNPLLALTHDLSRLSATMR